MPITPPLVVWSPIWRFALLIFLLVITARLLARLVAAAAATKHKHIKQTRCRNNKIVVTCKS
jgi:hypothetical protein